MSLDIKINNVKKTVKILASNTNWTVRVSFLIDGSYDITKWINILRAMESGTDYGLTITPGANGTQMMIEVGDQFTEFICDCAECHDVHIVPIRNADCLGQMNKLISEMLIHKK